MLTLAFSFKKSDKIGQNREKRNETKFGAQFTSKQDAYDRINQTTLHYKRNLLKIQLLLLSQANRNLIT